MRPSSAVHPRLEDEEAPPDPEPPSRKARKYIDRKAPKVNFLRKIYWSKRRRALFFILTLACFLANCAVIVNFSFRFKNHNTPPPVREVFLGYNFLYNTQGAGAISGSDWLLQMIWRSFWFYAQILYSVRILYLRVVNIKHHEKDIGTWLPKDRKMLLHKLGRLAFLLPVAVILLADVMPMKNPTIINASFLKKCQLTPSYRLGLQDIFEIDSNTACNNTDMLSRLPAPETTYKGHIPDGVEGGMAGQFMISMIPVGTCFDCSSFVEADPPYHTFDTRPIKTCKFKTYQFSNWITTSETCDALQYNRFYRSTFIPDSNFQEQWFCNTNVTKNSTHMTVFYDTAFGRAKVTNCVNPVDADFIKGPPALSNDTEASHILSNMTQLQINTLLGRDYPEYHECDEVQVSCLEDALPTKSLYRSVALYGCKRVIQGSLTADSDQKDWDSWLNDWVYSYKLAAAGMAIETLWDYVEYAAYVFI